MKGHVHALALVPALMVFYTTDNIGLNTCDIITDLAQAHKNIHAMPKTSVRCALVFNKKKNKVTGYHPSNDQVTPSPLTNITTWINHLKLNTML
jgi:hypothetical protein